ncbi:DUF2780 domain-containing protein [Ectopseudomonas mendocina]|uniref:DUF2780 domain-containing protein n=1 Tax=Ectopseudomonas mendocina TaxID=300 RepID=A0ABZ2RH39_ECTME
MKISRSVVLASVLSLGVSPVFAAGFNLNDAAGALSTLSGGKAATGSTAQTANLISALSDLNVTPQQAVGGTGAMLSLAKNQLSGTDYSQLTQSVPGVEKLVGSEGLSNLSALSGLLGKKNTATPSSALQDAVGNVQNAADLNSAFSALGMDGGMVSQFAPILLQYLGQQGASNSLLSSLGNIWGAAK